MMRERIYADHASTTPVRAEVLDAMLPFFDIVGFNPSSVHADEALRDEDVAAIERRRAHAHEHLTFARRRDLDLVDPQILRSADGVQPGGAHRRLRHSWTVKMNFTDAGCT